jgi:DNA-binding response OmpR family regulator
MTPRILAVDDDKDMLMMLRVGLEAEGYEVLTATRGMEALERARADMPDLILLDVMMPQMDGFEVLSNLKQDETTSAIPVIMVTAVSERRSMMNALSGGTDYYLVKPYSAEELQEQPTVRRRVIFSSQNSIHLTSIHRLWEFDLLSRAGMPIFGSA